MPYSRLPAMLSVFDVAMIPFRVNDLTAAVSPIKLFEYLAGGRPVVATPLPECRDYPVRIAASAEEFVKQVEWCAGPGRQADYRRSLRECAAANSWTDRAKLVLSALKAKGLADES